ncbi:O-antigen ligase family protein [Vibrio sp. WJH972]
MIISFSKEKTHEFAKSLPLLLLLIFVTDVLNPSLSVKNTLMELDLSAITESQGSGALVKQVYMILLLFFSIYMWGTHSDRAEVKSVNRSTILLLSLFSLMFASMIWSDFIMLTAKRAIFQTMLVIVIYSSVMLLGSTKRVMETIYIYFVALAAYICLFTIVFPGYAFDVGGEMSAFYTAKNYLGLVAFFGCSISYYFVGLNKRHSGKMLALWLLILLLTQSKTSISLMGMIFAYNAISRNHLLISLTTRTFLFTVLGIFFIVPLVTYFYSSVDFFDVYGSFFGTIDLTGRGQIWQLSIEQVNQNPFLGVGFAAFWGTGVIPDMFNIQYSFLQFINQSHNGYIDTLVQLGTVGLVVVLTMMMSLWKELMSIKNTFLINTFFFCVIHNVTESSFVRDSHLVWIMILFMLSISFLENNTKEVENTSPQQ